jgi:hypothetical protein
VDYWIIPTIGSDAMDEKEKENEALGESKVWLDLQEVGVIYQDLQDLDAQAVLVMGGLAYIIDMQLLKNRLLKFNTEILKITDYKRY